MLLPRNELRRAAQPVVRRDKIEVSYSFERAILHAFSYHFGIWEATAEQMCRFTHISRGVRTAASPSSLSHDELIGTASALRSGNITSRGLRSFPPALLPPNHRQSSFHTNQPRDEKASIQMVFFFLLLFYWDGCCGCIPGSAGGRFPPPCAPVGLCLFGGSLQGQTPWNGSLLP